MRTVLPEGYGLCRKLDLENDRRAYRCVSLLTFGLLAAVGIAGLLLLPKLLVERKLLAVQAAVFVLSAAAVLLLHGPLHALLLRLMSGVKPGRSGKGLLPVLSSEAFFCPAEYRLLVTGPFLAFSLVTVPLLILAPSAWKWVFFWAEGISLAASAEDFYLFFYTLSLPRKGSLLRDNGRVLQLFMPEGFESERIS